MSEKSYDLLAKILIVGESGVGKTCIIHKFIRDEFFQSHLSTIAIDFKMKILQLEDKKIKMQIWDTAGQERFKSLTSGFFKGSDGIMVCFALNDRRSFDRIVAWLEEIRKHSPEDSVVFLIGNKVDLNDRVIQEEEI